MEQKVKSGNLRIAEYSNPHAAWGNQLPAPQATNNEHSLTLETVTLRKSASRRRESMVWHPYMRTRKRNYTNELTYKIDLENETYEGWGWGEEEEEGTVREFGMDMDTLVYSK